MTGPPEDPVAAPFQGGWYCAKDFVGDPSRVD
jgi:uronate dehydrogenase